MPKEEYFSKSLIIFSTEKAKKKKHINLLGAYLSLRRRRSSARRRVSASSTSTVAVRQATIPTKSCEEHPSRLRALLVLDADMGHRRRRSSARRQVSASSTWTTAAGVIHRKSSESLEVDFSSTCCDDEFGV